MGDILELVDRYQELLEKKAALADETKENNKALEELRQELSEQMIEQEVPRISRGGYSFSLTEKVNYSKRSEEYLYENGLDFFETLRENGLADLIVERVDPRTLSATLKGMAEDEGIPDDVLACVSVYETYDITRRKETNKALKHANAKKED